jgi:hypothetical protein
MSDDLKTLFKSEAVAAGGETFDIAPFKFGQLPKVTKCLSSIAEKLQGGNVVEIAAAGGEDLINLVMLATGKSRAWFDELPMDEGLELIAAIITVNRDFFVARMAPILTRVTAALTGAKSLPDSSPAATDGATSETTT